MTVTLRDAQGELVELRPLADSQSPFFEIVPRALLQPDTRYTLQLTFTQVHPSLQAEAVELNVSFTTGHELDADDGGPPPVTLSHYHATHVTSCDPGQEASCIGLPAEELYVWNVAGEARGGASRGSFFTRMRASPVPSFDCLEVRRRSPSGRLSQPGLVCEDDGPRHELDVLELDEGRALRVGCDQRGVLVGGEEVGKLLDAAGASEPDEIAPEEPDPAMDAPEEPVEDAESPPQRMPPRRRADPASCSASPASRSSAASAIALALVLLALRMGRRRQG